MTSLVIALLLVGLVFGQNPSNEESWIKPPVLRSGDTIAIVAPSSPVNVEQIQVYSQILQKLGYRVLLPENIGRANGYLAGSDSQRADELNQMIRDPKVKAIFPARGGYGLTRILDRLDYASLRSSPKIITGYSDITALHLAIARKCRLITFHSPVPMTDLWRGDLPEYAFANSMFRRTLFELEYPKELSSFLISPPKDRAAETLVGGIAKGRLMGGNLTLISATMGTPFQMDANNVILFLEDVDEAPYRIDRMLSQLRLSGILSQVRGVVLGDFSHADGATQEEMKDVLREYFGQASVPVIWNFPIGHIPANATLPIGAWVELNADLCILKLLEDPVELKSNQ